MQQGCEKNLKIGFLDLSPNWVWFFVNPCGGMGGDSASGEVPHGLGGDVTSRAKEQQDQEVCHPASAAARSCVRAFPRVCFLPLQPTLGPPGAQEAEARDQRP